MTPRELAKSRERHEKWFRKHRPDIAKDALQEELDLMEAMEASYTVATLTCACGRVHEVEFTPPEYNQGFVGCFCACGHEVHFKDTSDV